MPVECNWCTPPILFLFVSCAAQLVAVHGSAEEIGAREHFSRGVASAQRGDMDDAASEFETAYRISPNYSVLYNLGQVYIALGKPVDAVRAFEDYLAVGGAKISGARRSDVEAVIALSKRRIGQVSISAEPANAEISIDGRSLGASSREAVALVVGEHSITATATGYVPFIGVVQVLPAHTVAFRLSMQQEMALLPQQVGQLTIDCVVPAVHISLDGVEMASFPASPLFLPVGRHEVTFQRSGYVSQSVTAEVDRQRAASVVCSLRSLPDLPSSQTGFLSFLIEESGAELRIDGRRSAETVRLPSGPHLALVRRTGFADWKRLIFVRPGFPQAFRVHLQPTPEHAQELRRTAGSRRAWAYAIGGVGASLTGAATALYIDNNKRYRNWTREHDEFASDIQSQNWSPGLTQRAGELQTTAASIQARDDVALGLSLLGGSLLVYAVGSWLSARP